ncbi:MAG: beta-N-acetylglucosaminidase domain-containing protein [Chitinispirillales bacterium]|jgi:hypothetical protein|nr:beta-N-acetylglucosaminidase domain-containing protein [Chitinispirillales bacterium]
MKLCGYIEGFYGRIFDWNTRKKIVKNVFDKGMNTYLYAPKEDRRHRVYWKEDYPAEEKKMFDEIMDFANKRNCEFIPAIAPGLSYDYDDDYVFIKKKIIFFENAGAKSFALTMDDISVISPNPQKNLGVLHAELLKKIKDDFAGLQILFCPTVYANDLVNDKNCAEYLESLQKNIPENILLLWTGDSTISKEINKKSLSHAINLFEKNIVIWDNFYSIDYAPNRIFVGNYENRDREFCEKSCAGLLLNGTGLAITDEIILEIFDAWIHNKNWTEEEIKNLLINFGVPQKLFDYMPAISSPYKKNYKLPNDLCATDFFTEIVAKWQSPLKIEWYSALHAIFSEIRIANAKKPFSREWYAMRYLPGIVKRMTKNKF